MKKLYLKLLKLFKPQGGHKGHTDQVLDPKSKDAFLSYWRHYAIECSAKNIPLEEVIDRLKNVIDGHKLDVNAKINSQMIAIKHERDQAMQAVAPIEDNPEVYISNALDHLPKEAFTEVSQLEAKLEETQKSKMLINEKLLKLKTKYPDAEIEF